MYDALQYEIYEHFHHTTSTYTVCHKYSLLSGFQAGFLAKGGNDDGHTLLNIWGSSGGSHRKNLVWRNDYLRCNLEVLCLKLF